jgi:hypothetical protein
MISSGVRGTAVKSNLGVRVVESVAIGLEEVASIWGVLVGSLDGVTAVLAVTGDEAVGGSIVVADGEGLACGEHPIKLTRIKPPAKILNLFNLKSYLLSTLSFCPFHL